MQSIVISGLLTDIKEMMSTAYHNPSRPGEASVRKSMKRLESFSISEEESVAMSQSPRLGLVSWEESVGTCERVAARAASACSI